MIVPREIAACARCREIADTWWEFGLADDLVKQRGVEFDLYEHLEDHHPAVRLHPATGCAGCSSALSMSMLQFGGAELTMHRPDGTPVNTVTLHYVHHLLQHTAELQTPTRGLGFLTSGHTITVHLYRPARSSGPGAASPAERGHDVDITVEVTAPVIALSDERVAVFRTAMADLERDLPYRELDRLGEDAGMPVRDLAGLARWVHAGLTRRLDLGPQGQVRVPGGGAWRRAR